MDNNNEDEYDLNTPPPSTVATEDDVAPEPRFYEARLILQNHLYDELLNRYKLAITRLRELTREANSLQEDNEWLRLANEDLILRLNRLLPSSEDDIGAGGGADGNSSSNNNNSDGTIVGSNSPTSVINNNNNEERFLLPKSISVQSLGYFKLKSSLPSTPTSITTPTVATSSNQLIRFSQDVNGPRIRLQKGVEKAIEMDVYNQGMYKTELCNKWQQTNTCPYRQHCRFAHGFSELRPVIRHPRYKSQVCRMILAGATCPYGHRCHFSHATTSTTRLN